MTPEQAYEQICELAREHALVIEATGGVVTIVHPDTQKEHGLYEKIQWMHGRGKHPKTKAFEEERAAESERQDARDSGADAAPVTGSTPAAAHQDELWPNAKVRSDE